MADKHEPGAGDVELELDGETVILRPSLEACLQANKLRGNIAAAIQACGNMDFETICDVVALGMGATSGPQKKIVQQKVYQEGAIHCSAAAIEFLRVVLNGGRKPEEYGEEGDGQDQGPLSQSDSITTS